MTTYSVRCRHNACRHRRVVHTHPDEYKVVPACPACGNRKGWRIEQRAYNKRDLCRCAGVVGRDGNYPHNTTHPFCDQHPQGMINQMKRSGMSDQEIAEYNDRQNGNCPF